MIEIVTQLKTKFCGMMNEIVQNALSQNQEEQLIKELKEQCKTNPYELVNILGLDLFRKIKNYETKNKSY